MYGSLDGLVKCNVNISDGCCVVVPAVPHSHACTVYCMHVLYYYTTTAVVIRHQVHRSVTINHFFCIWRAQGQGQGPGIC